MKKKLYLTFAGDYPPTIIYVTPSLNPSPRGRDLLSPQAVKNYHFIFFYKYNHSVGLPIFFQLKFMFLVDLLDAGVEGGRVVAVEAGKAEVGAVTGLEKALLRKERQRVGLDGLTGLLKVS